jgi:NADPH-dependent 2,4-dienoyl-CoA reductase/sulfur reductase-like enzyme
MPPEAERPSRGTFPGVVLPTSRSRSTGFGLDDNTISGVNTRFVVVGAGMAGLLSAIKLREAGFTDITVYEKADRGA